MQTEFEYTTEDGETILVEGYGKVSHVKELDSNVQTVTNIKFKCSNENGTVFDKNLLSEDDQTNIEDMISNALTDRVYESDEHCMI